jgi:uncharacterized protein (DUF488 family)
MTIYTIGVYGTTEHDFFEKLVKNRIDTFCDIRQRRGVRGSEYAFVNSKRLQRSLTELNITYWHVLDLAPTTEIRKMQYEDDMKQGEKKRSRNQLGDVFSLAYKSMIMQKFNFNIFVDKLAETGSNRMVLFCVEKKPEACHRSIVADELRKRYGFEIIHI